MMNEIQERRHKRIATHEYIRAPKHVIERKGRDKVDKHERNMEAVGKQPRND